MPPQGGGGFVVIGDEAGSIGDVDGGGQDVEHLPKVAIAAQHGLARRPKKV